MMRSSGTSPRRTGTARLRRCCVGVCNTGARSFPNSPSPTATSENIDVFDFELSDDEMTAIDALDTGRRGGPERDAVTLEAFGRDIPKA